MKIPDGSELVWKTLMPLIRNPHGVAGVMGNLYAESGLNPKNLQNSYEKRLGMTDEQYTKAVDSGKYKDFATDAAGYGIAQWTFSTRKQNLYGLCKSTGTSVGDLKSQATFLVLELYNYSYVLNKLRSALSVREASDVFLYHFEKPASVTNGLAGSSDKRAQYSLEFYEEFKDIKPPANYTYNEYVVLKRGSKGDTVKQLQTNLISLGYSLGKDGADGVYGKMTENAVREYQLDRDITVDGKAGALTQCLINTETDLCGRSYTVTVSRLTSAEAVELVSKYPNAQIVN